MRRWFRLLPLLLTALWLPLQAVAGITMPFCRHAAEQSVPETTGHEAHCPGHAAEEASAPAAIGCDQDCDGCELCHLATAGYMPATPTLPAHMPAGRDYVAAPALASPSFIPDPPQYPPPRLS